MTFFGQTEHFSGKNGALRWSILVRKQKHNIQKPSANVLLIRPIVVFSPFSFTSPLSITRLHILFSKLY